MENYAEKSAIYVKSYRQLSLFLGIGTFVVAVITIFMYSTNPLDEAMAKNGNYDVFLFFMLIVFGSALTFLRIRAKRYYKPENVKMAWYDNAKDENNNPIADSDIRSLRLIQQQLLLEVFILEGLAIVGLTLGMVLAMGGEMHASYLDVLFFVPALFHFGHVFSNRDISPKIESLYKKSVEHVVKDLKI